MRNFITSCSSDESHILCRVAQYNDSKALNSNSMRRLSRQIVMKSIDL